MTLLLFTVSLTASAQSWISFPATASWNWLSAGDLDVPGEQLTIEALITPSDPEQIVSNIVSKHFAGWDANYLLRPAGFGVTTIDYHFVENPCVFQVDSTHHIAATYDGDSLRYFVNGYEVNSIACNGSMFQNDHPTSIGNISTAGYDEQFKGLMDEVRIWNIARTEQEIRTNMLELADPTLQSGLMAYYEFEGDYHNAQGNTAWDCTAVGTALDLAANNLFSGSLKRPSCEGELAVVDQAFPDVGIHICPNPTSAALCVSPRSRAQMQALLIIMNCLGQPILTLPLNGNQRKTIDLSPFANGVYFVEVRYADGTRVTERVVKQ